MKTRIINAFIEETKMSGIKFTMDELVKRLGISKRTLYENFSSKEEILNTIIQLTVNEFDEQTAHIINNANLTLVEKIRQTIVVVPKYNDFYDLRILAQLQRYYPEQWELVNKEFNEWDDLKKLLEEGIQTNLIVNINVDLLMKLIIDAMNLTLDQEFFFKNNISAENALDSIVRILLHGIIKEE